MKASLGFLFASLLCANAAPEWVEDRFELPAGFRIYKAAPAELTGGSYDLCFDGEGRLLVGDGTAVRRLRDSDNDGVFDNYEVIAENLGWRGPQGLLVHGDRLFAVGGDGVQMFEGYRSGKLVHRGRIGQKFNTGGDHDAHTLLRGHDGFIYFISGDGGGAKDRVHITEESSPMRYERAASVFRISPDGSKWECVAAGGRNPPNLGMNYLGDLFSFDSDMEWHVGLPWWRPVRLNHWAIGGDQGWQEVGAYPPYYPDCVPGILDVGRGSPTWGVFYEHKQFPGRYKNAYLVCDYRWKKESDDQYHTSGRLVSFALNRAGAGWQADMEVLAQPKAGARDGKGSVISFALVDCEVAPDGSVYLSDHNQGVWRLVHHKEGVTKEEDAPWLLSQSGSEWSRLKQEAWLATNLNATTELMGVSTNSMLPVSSRLGALKLLAQKFAALPLSFLAGVTDSPDWEIRGYGAWLLGLRGGAGELERLAKLSDDSDSFVRRRAMEGLTRMREPAAVAPLLRGLEDEERLIRHIAMAGLIHHPHMDLKEQTKSRSPEARMRILLARHLRRDMVTPEDAVATMRKLLDEPLLSTENKLDFLRLAEIFRGVLAKDNEFVPELRARLLREFPDSDPRVRWEQSRLIGEYRFGEAFSKMLGELEREPEHVTQFHLAQGLAKLPSGWSESEQARLLKWLLGTQGGWFAELSSKGVEFPSFWSTVLTDFATHHRGALLKAMPQITLDSLLGGVMVQTLGREPDGVTKLIELYHATTSDAARIKVVRALQGAPRANAFLLEAYAKANSPELRDSLVAALAAQPPTPENLAVIKEGLASKNAEVARACAVRLADHQPVMDQALAGIILAQMTRRELFNPMEGALVALTKEDPPHRKEIDPKRRPAVPVHERGMQFWKNWYGRVYGRSFDPAVAGAAEKSDEELHRYLLSGRGKGNALNGSKVYETLQCNTCHGGGVTPGREGALFGPDLIAVTKRLNKQEFADAIVYPSRQVPDRYKAIELELKDGKILSGFITESNQTSITLAEREQVRRIAKPEIAELRPQTSSLMPERLLNRLSWQEIDDLVAFLDEGIQAAKPVHTVTPKN